MPSRPVTRCGACASTRLESVLDLGSTPPACSMPVIGDTEEQQRFPLELLACRDCGLAQLSWIVDPELVFHPEYPYSTGNSRQLRQHFAGLAAQLHPAPDDLVVDIGANDGTFLENLDCRRVAVEPTLQIMRAQADRLDAYCAFFGADLAAEILHDHGPARYVTASNVLAHVADPHDFLEGVRILLADDGKFVCENHDLASVIDGQWDTVYHEHLRYYTPGTLARLLERHGLYVYAEQSLKTHGGSFRSWATLRPMLDAIAVNGSPDPDYKGLRDRAQMTRWHLRSLVASIRAGGHRIGAIGATARATTILGYCGLTHDDIEAVYEVSGSDKLGRYMPGTRIPVLDEQALFEPHAPDHVLLLSWHLADWIVPKLHPPQSREGRQYRGSIIVPLPQPRTIRPKTYA